ncbi:MAG: extracellular solute-binding protein [Chloroflexota bacterium]|nr:extracellular solute-binding protein [Chloroflexota bacterium]
MNEQHSSDTQARPSAPAQAGETGVTSTVETPAEALPARRISRAGVLRGATMLAAGTVSAATLAACGGSQGAGQPAGGVGQAPVRLQMFNQAGDQQTIDDWTKMMAPFTEKYPHVTFDIGGPAAGVQFVDRALTFGAGGTPPDITYSVTRNGPTIFEGGLTQDMSTIVKREKIDLKDVSKPVLENFDWKGKMLALPYDPGYAFVEYNKSLFEQAGVPDPGTLWAEKKWDWNAFVQSATAFARASTPDQQRHAFTLQNWEGDYVSFVRSLGGDLLDKDRTKLALGDGPSVAALNMWAELSTKHKVATPIGAGPTGLFNSGSLAMYSSHPGNIRPIQKYVKDNGAQWTWDVVPHPAPAGKRPAPVLFTNGLYLWRGIASEGPAVEALKFLMTDDSMLRYGALTGRDPARTSLISQQMKNLGIPENDPKTYLKLYQELTNDVRGLPWTVNYVEWHTIVQQQILAPISKGEKSVQEAVSAAAPAVNAILARK